MTDDSVNKPAVPPKPIHPGEDHKLATAHERTTFSVWAGPTRQIAPAGPWRFPADHLESAAAADSMSEPESQPTPFRRCRGFGRSLFADEQEKRWGWQLPLFDGFFGPLPPLEDLTVPDHLDDTLPLGDMPGQLFLDLGL